MEKKRRRSQRRPIEEHVAALDSHRDASATEPSPAPPGSLLSVDAVADENTRPGIPTRLEVLRESVPRPAPQTGGVPRNPHSSMATHEEPVHEIPASPNPDPARKWPLYVSTLLTVALVLLALNIEQHQKEANHWAAPSATGIQERLIARAMVEGPVNLPTEVPASYYEEQAAFALADVRPTPTGYATVPPVTSSPQPTKIPLLKKSMQGETVKAMQVRLVELGYLAEDQANGKFESSTVQAVKAFQDNNRLDADGMAGAGTLETLFHPSAVAAPTPTPAPTRKDEPYVWATAKGTYYHGVQTCSNMKGATEIALSDAQAKYKPCPKCDPPQ